MTEKRHTQKGVYDEMTDTVGPSVRSAKHILKRLVRGLKGDKDLTFPFSLARESALFFLLRSHAASQAGVFVLCCLTQIRRIAALSHNLKSP